MSTTEAPNPTTFDVSAIRSDFAILRREVHGSRIVYLDSAASSQKPDAVLDGMATFARTSYANVHRGVYTLAEEATAAYEGARSKVARFIGAPVVHEVVFTRNATESINLVAQTWGRANLGPGDVVVLTEMEHHANIVPWQLLAAERGIELRGTALVGAGPARDVQFGDFNATAAHEREQLLVHTPVGARRREQSFNGCDIAITDGLHEVIDQPRRRGAKAGFTGVCIGDSHCRGRCRDRLGGNAGGWRWLHLGWRCHRASD